MCVDCRTLWGTFVNCDIELLQNKVNWIDLNWRNLMYKRIWRFDDSENESSCLLSNIKFRIRRTTSPRCGGVGPAFIFIKHSQFYVFHFVRILFYLNASPSGPGVWNSSLIDRLIDYSRHVGKAATVQRKRILDTTCWPPPPPRWGVFSGCVRRSEEVEKWRPLIP